jgi:hypothetical protein
MSNLIILLNLKIFVDQDIKYDFYSYKKIKT